MGLLTKLFGTHSDHELKQILPIVDRVEALEETWRRLSDAELVAKTAEFKSRIAAGEDMESLLPEAFATVREASDRVLGMRPYRVQLVGGVVLHQGRIAEMKTGEGKTLVATLPAYLNALSGSGVHIVTVNDYLARRDSEWMGKIYRFLGLKVGLIVHGLNAEERRASYAADITYGTNNEFGFDYLRDNMAIYSAELVQRGHAFAIVDEVDSILIDEARTPLIISGQGDKSTTLYEMADQFASRLRRITLASTDSKEEESESIDADYVVDEKGRSVTLTARGIKKAEEYFHVDNLSDAENTTLSHHINQAIRAHGIMKRDIDYVVKDGEVIIVDEFTGRLMFGRRYSEGLHQAIEAKEHVKVARESKTLATITFQNYFRLYHKLSGMTGTALTEEEEFGQIYKLDVIEIPTNRPLVRLDNPDVVYKTEAGKLRAILDQIEQCYKRGQPVLVGTISIEKNELLSKLLAKRGIRHNVLNAKNHEKEAEIIAQAGKVGSVTIATNMAGRGTDIMLGGNAEYLAKNDLRKAELDEALIAEATSYTETDNPEILDIRARFAETNMKYKEITSAEADRVRATGGLYIIGTERHESRRIDNQLRGRAGRQGDPGETRFYVSLEDDIMRLFGSERVMGMMNSLGIDEDTPIEQKVLSNAIESAQKKVESRNFQTRKNVLEYDDVMNKQREIIYAQRKKVLDGEDLKSYMHVMIENMIRDAVHSVTGEQHYLSPEQFSELCRPFDGLFLQRGELRLSAEDLEEQSGEELTELILQRALESYDRKEAELGSPLMRELERVVMLRVVDEYWMDHIDAMTELRQGIGLRAYAQTDPIIAYKQEGFSMFEAMVAAIREETVRRVFLARIKSPDSVKREKVAKNATENVGGDDSVKKQPVRKSQKVGRNDPCPCGSGKKYKKCCGMNGND